MKGLSIVGLEVARAKRVLLRDFSLEIRVGERVGLRGPSGSGKSSLLRAICGLDDPSAGSVRLGGSDPEQIGWPTFRRRVMLVPQRSTFPPGRVSAVLRLPFAFKSAPAVPSDQALRAALERVGIGETWEQMAAQLSEGQAQRLALVRALSMEPDFVLLDEPTSALDGPAAAAVEALVRDEGSRRGLGALIVTHDSDQAERWCDRTVDLQVGAHA